MDSSILPKDEIWFLRVCHHISNAVYESTYTSRTKRLFVGGRSRQIWCLSLCHCSISCVLESHWTGKAASSYMTCWLRKILLRLMVHYRIYKRQPSVPILSQINPAYVPHLTSWRSILILYSHLSLGLPSDLFLSGFPTKTLYTPLLSPIRATCPAHLILLGLITRTILGEQYRSLSSSLCSFLHSPVTSSLLGPNILLNTLFSNTLSLRSSLNLSDQVSHPCKTTGKIINLYIS